VFIANSSPWLIFNVTWPYLRHQNELDAKRAQKLLDNGLPVRGRGRNNAARWEATDLFSAGRVLFAPGRSQAGGVAVSGLEMVAELHAPATGEPDRSSCACAKLCSIDPMRPVRQYGRGNEDELYRYVAAPNHCRLLFA